MFNFYSTPSYTGTFNTKQLSHILPTRKILFPQYTHNNFEMPFAAPQANGNVRGALVIMSKSARESTRCRMVNEKKLHEFMEGQYALKCAYVRLYNNGLKHRE